MTESSPPSEGPAPKKKRAPSARKRAVEPVPEHPPEVVPGGSQAGESPVLAEEGRPEQPRVVGAQGGADAGGKKRARRVGGKSGKRTRRDVGGEAQVEERPPAGQLAEESGILGGPEAVGDAHRPEPAEGLGDAPRPGPLAGVDERREPEPPHTPVDSGEIPGGERRLVAAQPEPHDPAPADPFVSVEDPSGGLGAPLPHAVEEDPHAAPRPGFEAGENGVQSGHDLRVVEPHALEDGGGHVDLGPRDALPGEPPHEIASDPGVVRGTPKVAANVAVELEKLSRRARRNARRDGRERREDPGIVAKGEVHERAGGDGALEVQMQLGLPAAGELPEEAGGGGVDLSQAPGASYRAQTLSTPSGVGTVQISQARTVGLPRERLWLRALALGIDLFLFAGLPFVLSAFGVFLALLFARAPSQGLDAVFHLAQAVFVVAFLIRDKGGASPGKRLLGLRVVTRDRRPPGLRASVLRNLPLLVPLWNLAEAWAVLRHPDMLRNGDRIAGTRLIEES